MKQRVKWAEGTTAHIGPRPSASATPAAVRRAVWVMRKRMEVAAEITRLELAQRVRGPGTDTDARLAFEQARAACLAWCVEASTEDLQARRGELVARLGADVVAALNAGALRPSDVPPQVAHDLAALSILNRLLSGALR